VSENRSLEGRPAIGVRAAGGVQARTWLAGVTRGTGGIVLAWCAWGAQAGEDPVQSGQLNPVVVTATRTERDLADVPVRTEIVTREEIERTHARTLTQALENVPGLQIREIHGKSGYELSLQGLSSDQVLVLIDGLPISASTGSTVDLSQYLLADVERIEIVKGAASAQYGSSAMGGVVNVITRPIRQGFHADVTADVGSYGKQNVSGKAGRIGASHGKLGLEGGGEQWRLRLSADLLDDKGFSVDPDAWPRQGDAIKRQQYALRGDWLPTASQRYWIEPSTYREDDTQRFDYYLPPTYVPRHKTEKITRDRVSGGGEWLFDNEARLQLSGVVERYDSHSDTYSSDWLITARHAEQNMSHATLQFDLPEWRRQRWQVGGDYHYEDLAQTNNGVSEFTRSKVDRRTFELFGQNDILFNDRWELVLGMRWQNDSDFGTHLAPKASLKGRLIDTADWQGVFRASLGNGYRVPNLKERYYVFDHSHLGYMVKGNPDLRPESSLSAQLGFRLDMREDLTLEVNGFYNRVKDLIQVDQDNIQPGGPGVVIYTYDNVARARTQGVETGLRWLARPGLTFNLGYTFTDTRNLDTGEELTRRPRHMARLGADWRFMPRTVLTARLRYQSSELISSSEANGDISGAPADGVSPAWSTLDLALNHEFQGGWAGFVGVNNLFNRQRDFADPSDFGPVRGRFVYAGVRYRFSAAP